MDKMKTSSGPFDKEHEQCVIFTRINFTLGDEFPQTRLVEIVFGLIKSGIGHVCKLFRDIETAPFVTLKKQWQVN